MKFVIPLPPSKNDTHTEEAVAKGDELHEAVVLWHATRIMRDMGAKVTSAWVGVKRAMKVVRRRSPEYEAYRGRVADLLGQQGVRPMSGDVRVSVTAFFPDRRRDMPNIVDPLLDALEGHAYVNDRQVTEFGRWSREVDADDPRCVVTVEPLELDLFADVDTRDDSEVSLQVEF